MKAAKPAPKVRRTVPAPETIPSGATSSPVPWGWMALLILSVVLLGGSAYLAHRHILSGPELSVFHFINDWPNNLRGFFLVATIAPESLWIGVVAVIVVFLLKMYRTTWQLAVAIIGGYVVTYIGKHFIARPRPIELINTAHVRVEESGMGFPSGHTMILTIILLMLWPYLPRGWRWLIVLLGVLAMAVSRIYLGVHAPLDVVGGFAVGAIIVSVLRILPERLRNFFRFD